MDTRTLMLIIAPLLVINLGVLIIALRMWMKDGVRNLNKWVWLLIILLLNTIGPILFMILGKGEHHEYDADFDFKS